MPRIQATPAQQLERHRAAHGFQLLGAIHVAHASASKQRLDAVAAQALARRQRFAAGVARDGPPRGKQFGAIRVVPGGDGRSEEHTSELQSLMRISYAVFCLKKNTNTRQPILVVTYT